MGWEGVCVRGDGLGNSVSGVHLPVAFCLDQLQRQLGSLEAPCSHQSEPGPKPHTQQVYQEHLESMNLEDIEEVAKAL